MTRRTNDWYPTPTWATEELLRHHTINGVVFEPCVGDGAIATPLMAAGCDVITNDLDSKWPATTHLDARTDEAWPGEIEWTVTNPPFLIADRILPVAVAKSKAVAMLLRLSFLEPCEGRAAFLAANPPDQLIVLPRISFTGDGKTDSVTCAWMIWTVAVRGPSIRVVPRLEEQQGSLLAETPG